MFPSNDGYVTGVFTCLLYKNSYVKDSNILKEVQLHIQMRVGK